MVAKPSQIRPAISWGVDMLGSGLKFKGVSPIITGRRDNPKHVIYI